MHWICIHLHCYVHVLELFCVCGDYSCLCVYQGCANNGYICFVLFVLIFEGVDMWLHKNIDHL